jgi:hypothetical protein
MSLLLFQIFLNFVLNLFFILDLLFFFFSHYSWLHIRTKLYLNIYFTFFWRFKSQIQMLLCKLWLRDGFAHYTFLKKINQFLIFKLSLAVFFIRMLFTCRNEYKQIVFFMPLYSYLYWFKLSENINYCIFSDKMLHLNNCFTILSYLNVLFIPIFIFCIFQYKSCIFHCC